VKISFLLVLLACSILTVTATPCPPTPQTSSPPVSATLELIRQQRYNDAINRLEQILEVQPAQPQALTYLATAQMYSDRDFLKAQKSFEEAFRMGGGATFFVNHSHEKLAGNEIVDYCRGWLHLRKEGIEFVPSEGEHGFSLAYSKIVECKQNRWSKSFFHLKFGEKNQNFRGRTGDESEVLLIVALYKKFAL